jgi:hypothetical protein
MDFKIIGKDKVGGAVLLLLIVLISQARILDTLFDTLLGRAVLIGFILTISYMNKILGVVSVLLIIIAFSNSGLMEGLEGMPDVKKTPDSKTEIEKNKIKSTKPKPVTNATTNSTTHDTTHTTTTSKKDDDINKESAPKATEGFDILGKERSIQQGKNSNSIQTNKDESGTFMPFEDWSSMDSYSIF